VGRAWGKSHADRGIYIPYGEVSMPHHEVAPLTGDPLPQRGANPINPLRRTGHAVFGSPFVLQVNYTSTASGGHLERLATARADMTRALSQ